MPAPPARMRSAKVPCGFSSNCNSPLATNCSNSLFSPTYVETIFFTWRFWRRRPMPKSSTPALLLTMVRSLVPLRRTAAIRFSGMPHKPKPPMRIVAPSGSFSMAASAEEMRLSTKGSEVREEVYSKWKLDRQLGGGRRPWPYAPRPWNGKVQGGKVGTQDGNGNRDVDFGLSRRETPPSAASRLRARPGGGDWVCAVGRKISIDGS